MRTLPLLLALGLLPAAGGASAQTLLDSLASPNEEEGGLFGYSVSGVPDLDGDGAGDLLIGALKEDVLNGTGIPVEDAGRAYVVSGATGAVLHTLQSPQPKRDASFGERVAWVPDTDGDAIADLLVDAYWEEAGAPWDGQVHLYSGATGAPLRSFVSAADELGSGFGYSLTGLSDTDGDGRGEVVAGSGENYAGEDGAGVVYVFNGATGALIRLIGSPNPEHFGFFGNAVAAVEDVDGDGRGDLLVGAYHEDPGASPGGAGRAYVFSGATGALLHTLASPNEQRDGDFGFSVSGVADVDGDGRGDLLIGAYHEGSCGCPNEAGRAYVFSGSTGALLYELGSPDVQGGGSNFGYSVSGAPDADGDGRGDLLIGALGSPSSSPLSAGRAYLFSGGLTGTAVEPDEPASLGLLAPRPNPFAGRATLAFDLPEAAPVRLSVYDVLGREVALLVDGYQKAGRHEVAFEASSLPGGTYLVRLDAGGTVAARRLTLVR